MSEPYLRKDVATLEEVSDGAGIDIGFLRDVIRLGPLRLSSD
jgi:hypothetical protein